MHTATRCLAVIFGSILAIHVAGCSPEVGSDKWCSEMKERPKGDWTVSEAADFAKHCVL